MELDREQIIKALECCASPEYLCEECPIDQNKKDDCICGQFLAKNALAIIKELTEENERLRAERDVLDSLVKDLRGRNKGLQSANESLAKDLGILEDELNECVQIKADTVREMHSEIERRCIEGGIYPAFVAKVVEDVEREMLEGKDV